MSTEKEGEGIIRRETKKSDLHIPWITNKIIAICVPMMIYFAWNSIISDSDETFNYWEPLHYLWRGRGLQTWEYSPEHALRPYAYLLLHLVPLKAAEWILGVTRKILIYKSLKVILALLSLACQYRLCRALAMEYGPRVARYSFVLFSLLPGCGQASWSLLPNSLSMNLVMLAWAYHLEGADTRVALLSLPMAMIGWPYGLLALSYPLLFTNKRAILGQDGVQVPVESISFAKWIEILVRRWTVTAIFAFVYFFCPILLLDYALYRRWTISWLNALLYNLFGGSARFGSESSVYYLKNLALNFNLGLPLFLISGLLKRGGLGKVLRAASMIALLNMLLFSVPRHKEERFLYPIYPLIVLTMAHSLASVKSRQLSRASMTIILCLGISRSLAVMKNYQAPQVLFTNIPSTLTGTICLAESWHRFPSHFFLQNDAQRMAFIGSFEGILPKYFSPENRFNSLNRPTSDQFLPMEECDYFVGFEKEGENEHFPTTIACYPEIDLASSPPISRWLYTFGLVRPVERLLCLRSK